MFIQLNTCHPSSFSRYDNYLNDSNRQSGFGALGMGLLNGDVSDDDSDDETLAVHGSNGDLKPKKSFSTDDEKDRLPLPSALEKFPAVPIVAPKPGYAVPVSEIKMPEPAASPDAQSPRSMQMPHPQQQQQQRFQIPAPAPLNLPSPRIPHQNGMLSNPRSPYAPPSVPSTPHPLQPPLTPITPAFAAPPKKKEEVGVSFSESAILRGKHEEAPLARRGEKGDEFWRRFSMVVKIESDRKEKTSSWLEKTQSGAARLSRWVWIVGLLLLILIGGAIGLGVYVSRNNTTPTTPKALGGSESEGVSFTPTTSATNTAGALGGVTSTSRHVSPTNTVAKRIAYPFPEPTPAPAPFPFVGEHLDSVLNGAAAAHKQQHQKRMMKRFV